MRLVWPWRGFSFSETGKGICEVQAVVFCKQNRMLPATFHRKNGALTWYWFYRFFSIAHSQRWFSFKRETCASWSELGQGCQFTLPTKLFKKNSDILFTAKAYNGRVVLEWLTHEVYMASTCEGLPQCDGRFHLIAAALKLWLAISECGVFTCMGSLWSQTLVININYENQFSFNFVRSQSLYRTFFCHTNVQIRNAQTLAWQLLVWNHACDIW